MSLPHQPIRGCTGSPNAFERHRHRYFSDYQRRQRSPVGLPTRPTSSNRSSTSSTALSSVFQNGRQKREKHKNQYQHQHQPGREVLDEFFSLKQNVESLLTEYTVKTFRSGTLVASTLRRLSVATVVPKSRSSNTTRTCHHHNMGSAQSAPATSSAAAQTLANAAAASANELHNTATNNNNITNTRAVTNTNATNNDSNNNSNNMTSTAANNNNKPSSKRQSDLSLKDLAPPQTHRREHSLHAGLVRERDKKHSFDAIYEVLEDIGHGGLCQIYKIKKRTDMVGGSSRPDLVRRRGHSFLFLPGLLTTNLLHNATGGFGSTSSFEQLKRMDSQASSVHSQASSSDNENNQGNRNRANSNSTSSHPPSPTGSGGGGAMASLHGNKPLYYALKVINLKLVAGGPEKIEDLKNEVEILKTLDHRSIIKAYETFQRPDTKQLVIVMELCTGGDLYARMPYTEQQVASAMKQVLSAVSYMHDRNVIHRDIKMENIMFESKHPHAAVKVIDFGLSAEYSKSESVLKERVGTLYSMSPETMQGSYTSQADLWSIGVCTYIMLSGGDKPFEGKTPKQVVARVLLGQYDFEQPVWKNISEQAKDFIRKLLVVKPEERMTAAEAVKHPFIKSASCSSNDLAPVDEELKQRVRESIVRYSESTEFRKLALNVIAKKSSTQEIFQLRRVFDEFDTDNTGTITLEEFKNALAQFDYSEEDLFAIFRKVDVNRNNVINYTEFLAAALETQGTIEEYRLAEAFDLLDSNDTGYITKKDLRHLLGKHTEEAYIDQLIKEADFKKDGKISYEEFLQVFAEKKHDKVYNLFQQASERSLPGLDVSETDGADKVLNEFGLLP